jgi:hypothetical protein
MQPSARPKWHAVLPVVLLLTLPSCLLVVSSSPTSITGATIVFVAIDDRGLLVASLSVSVVDLDGHWHHEGLTADDGVFRCAVVGGVKRIRAGVTPPSGFVLAGSDQWPREIDVPSDGNMEIQIRVRAAGQSVK